MKLKNNLGSKKTISATNKVFEFGAYTKGYGEFGWKRTGVPTKVSFGAALRHLIKWYTGEDRDDESLMSHTAHLGCNVHFMHEFTGNALLDNRPHKNRTFKVEECKKNQDDKVHLEDINWQELWYIAQQPNGIDKINAALERVDLDD